ncbi:hypothetical protein H9639_13240 [Arthrobacter sp. Sa2CUA1]|uniref:Uncharacterized protein n=1 Tax=Arthrobacter gallicola TaxID=2762225 RepID=A0ABR8UUP8_9MICC|nr:hypothetical protein [Arthrobacter gallicola]MBD7996262.1 hypothetical protein [Arthrobacter gallicola]
MNRTAKKSRSKQESGLGYLVLGSAIFFGSVALVFLGQFEVTSVAVAALVAGPVVGIWLFRFGMRQAWVALVCLVGALIVAFVLLTNVDDYGSAGVAWLGGLVGGSNIGVGWRAGMKKQKAPAVKKSAWLVDGRKFDTLAGARQAAETALRALDGKAKWRLTVVQGTARFEVAGGPASGYVCHRSVDGRTWAVLANQDLASDAMVEVSMGKAVGALPRRLVQDYGSVSAALEAFLRAPKAVPAATQWVTGAEAEGTRLGAN